MNGERRVHRPRTDALPAPLARAARAIAARLQAGGHQAWLVGGSVRDLALGRAPHEIDLATDARPERIEQLFERTVAVGRAFGTVVVVLEEADVELTTFRSESGYSDARRPDRVEFGASVEEDARRRDFTCNALFLDPSSDALRDPSGGMADLQAGWLRTVGEARERFAEDGLRLLRMARFVAQLALEPAPGLAEAARACGDALRGVSAERVLAELERVLAGPDPARALELLERCELLARALPSWADLAAAERTRRIARLARLPRGPGAAAGFALLLDAEGDADEAERALEALRASRELRRATRECGRVLAGLRALAEDAPRSRAVELARSSAFALVRGALRAALDEGAERALARVEARLGAQPARAELWPEPLLGSSDLEAAGLPRGPAWKQLLHEAEQRQLDGALATRAAALEWLARRVDELARGAQPRADAQVGGNTRRKAKDKG